MTHSVIELEAIALCSC